MKKTIVITEPEYQKAKGFFDRAVNEFKIVASDDNEEILANTIKKEKAKVVILGVKKYRDSLYKSLGSGGIIARFGVGHDGIDKKRAKKKNIYVTNTPGVLDVSVAEHAVWLMGCLAKKVAESHRKMRLGKWEPFVGFELKGKRLVIIGCGAIGCRVAKIASFGFSMDVAGYDIADLNQARLNKMYGISKFTRDYAEAVAQADVVSIHLAGIQENRHFFNEHRLKQIKKGALFINTSRGFIVDEGTLYNSLKKGHLAGAGLDVFEKEPYTPVSLRRDLRRLNNVLLTPHIGSNTKEACLRMAERCIKNIKLWQKKQFKNMDIINP